MSRPALEVAKDFWSTRLEYPPFPYRKERNAEDLKYLLSYFNFNSIGHILDYGCGTGELLTILSYFSNAILYGVDLPSPMYEHTRQKLSQVATFFMPEDPLPWTDLLICFGVLHYICDDIYAAHTLSHFKSQALLLRCPCSIDKRVEINKFSPELGGAYAANYRTVEETASLLSPVWKVIDIRRAFPEEIESKYGSRQFFFRCSRV
jgi:trans-aconitate methyltransferase